MYYTQKPRKCAVMETQMGTISVFQLSLVFCLLIIDCYFLSPLIFSHLKKCVIFGIVRPMIKE